MELNLTFEIHGDSSIAKDQFDTNAFDNIIKNGNAKHVFEVKYHHLNEYTKGVNTKNDVVLMVVATLKGGTILKDIEINCMKKTEDGIVFKLTDKMNVYLQDSISLIMSGILSEQILRPKFVRLLEVDPQFTEEEKTRNWIRGNKEQSISVEDQREDTDDDEDSRGAVIL